jgi:glycine dehydrogenase
VTAMLTDLPGAAGDDSAAGSGGTVPAQPTTTHDSQVTAVIPVAPRPTLVELENSSPFADRHIGPDAEAAAHMLSLLGYDSLDALTEAAVPGSIRLTERLNLPPARSESEVLTELRDIAGRNRVFRPMIGLGYHGTFTPPVILRNVMENPAWYTAYTPYQPEISRAGWRRC